MKRLSILLIITLIASVISGYAQFKNPAKYQHIFTETDAVPLASPETLLSQMYLPKADLRTDQSIDFLGTKTGRVFLFIGSEILRKTFDLGTFSPAPSPRSVSEYNGAVNRQILYAEPTSQEWRRSTGVSIFN